MLNRFIVQGNVGRDCEMKGEGKVASFSICWNEHKKDVKEPTAHWFNVVAFGKTAEFCQRFAKKGAQLIIEGTLKMESWEKNGEKKTAAKVIAERVHFSGGKQQGEAPQAPASEALAKAFGDASSGSFDDIPF